MKRWNEGMNSAVASGFGNRGGVMAEIFTSALDSSGLNVKSVETFSKPT